MANFMIRVELHSATAQNYVTLAENLSRIGIIDIITSADGRRFRLPPAMYCCSGNYAIGDILKKAAAAAAAAATGHRHAVVVTEGQSTWDGLQRV